MQIDWWTLGLQTVNALVLIWLLSRFLFRPIASILAEREATARRLLDDAAAAKASALSLEERARAAVDAMAADRAATIHAATTEAKDARDQLLVAARADADRMRSDMRAEIERAERSARRAEAERASLLAVDIARRLLGRLPASSRSRRLHRRPRGRGRGSAGNRARRFRRARRAHSDRAASAHRRRGRAVRGRLESALGHPLQFALRVDPTLLAGLELENAHTSIRNSLRADLEQISATLLKEPENER